MFLLLIDLEVWVRLFEACLSQSKITVNFDQFSFINFQLRFSVYILSSIAF